MFQLCIGKAHSCSREKVNFERGSLETLGLPCCQPGRRKERERKWEWLWNFSKEDRLESGVRTRSDKT